MSKTLETLNCAAGEIIIDNNGNVQTAYRQGPLQSGTVYSVVATFNYQNETKTVRSQVYTGHQVVEDEGFRTRQIKNNACYSQLFILLLIYK